MKGTFLTFLGGAVRNVLIVFAGLTLMATCTPANAQLQFGSRCQATFQNGWLPDINGFFRITILKAVYCAMQVVIELHRVELAHRYLGVEVDSDVLQLGITGGFTN